MISKLKKWFSIGQPATSGYDPGPSQFIYAFTNWNRRPPWSYYQADIMLLDPQVWFGLMIGNGPLMSAEVNVRCNNPVIKKFVKEQWDRIWAKGSTQILRTKQYGFLACEVVCKENDGRVEFDYLRDFHPIDISQLKVKGARIGIRVRQMQNSGVGKVDLYGPKALWLTYGEEYCRTWGRSLLERCYQPWYDKNSQGGALDLRRLHGFKDAWIGDVIKYPNKILNLPDGTKVHARDIAREAAENRASGAVMAFPSTVDKDTGKPEWEYEAPKTTGGQTAIPDWIHDLDWDILDGLLVPKEVVEAGGTGGGWSGRSVPFVGFLAVRDQEFSGYVRQITEQFLKPLTVLNYGKGADDFDVEPVPLVESMGQQVGEMGKPDLSKPQRAGTPVEQPDGEQGEAAGNADQFSADAESEIDKAASVTEKNPSDAQKEAGNYKKGRTSFHGLPITIETPKGSIRSGQDGSGNKWSVVMPHHYGYIRRTESEADGDHVDVFIGPYPDSRTAFIVDQAKPDSGDFDEHKIMLGFVNREQAKDAYLSAYSKDWNGLQTITPIDIEALKKWLDEGDTSQPAATQFSIADPPLASRSKTADEKEAIVGGATELAIAIRRRLDRLLKKN